ncbi:hypothetical protein M5D96_013666 [Drosophila gunungcola]|uniref:Dynein heavy chain n=1 Tax=Drosophila gunungcola TaxID=103775 RepID=A0A9P9YBM8_9MUSC|nr:hypothetical protein M5D96_013666 [Drosophila gunungcola]
MGKKMRKETKKREAGDEEDDLEEFEEEQSESEEEIITPFHRYELLNGLNQEERNLFREYEKYVDANIAENLVDAVITSSTYLRMEVDNRYENNTPIFEIFMELQEPNVVYFLNLDTSSKAGFAFFIETLLEDMNNIMSLLNRVAQDPTEITGQAPLGFFDQIIGSWFEVQRKWQYLESIFIGSEDIRSQLPEDSKRFDYIDKEFKALLAQMNADRNVPALVGTQIMWTTETNDAFAKVQQRYENALKDYNKKQWQSQLRHRWDSKIDDCFANICDAQFRYDYEYLGNTPRLVITPLTDRCYITLTQSLHLVMGGAPAGPAEQMDYKSIGDIHKGLAQTGAWGCFDEFNRISVEVLSVVAVQVKTSGTARKP